jgi:uroporphyrinogen decarboxylase
MMKQFIGHPHIANLGHGVYPDTHPDQVKIFIEAVKKFNS